MMWDEECCIERIPMFFRFQRRWVEVCRNHMQVQLLHAWLSMITNFKIIYSLSFQFNHLQRHRIHFVQQFQMVSCQLWNILFYKISIGKYTLVHVTRKIVEMLSRGKTKKWNFAFGNLSAITTTSLLDIIQLLESFSKFTRPNDQLAILPKFRSIVNSNLNSILVSKEVCIQSKAIRNVKWHLFDMHFV